VQWMQRQQRGRMVSTSLTSSLHVSSSIHGSDTLSDGALSQGGA
jgi:hypothetical protein